MLYGVNDLKNLGCFTNDIAFYNDKIIFGWYRDDIKDSDLEKQMTQFYGKLSNVPNITRNLSAGLV